MGRYTQENYTVKQYQKDSALVDAVESEMMIGFENPNRHISDKIQILRDVLGYNNLRVGSDKSEVRFLPLEDCNDGRINKVLKERYFAALNRINKFGNPTERINEGGLVVRINRQGQFYVFR